MSGPVPVLSVIVEQLLAPVPGGTGRYAEQITAAMAAAPPPGWSVRTVTAAHRDKRRAVIAGADGPHALPIGRRALAAAWQRGLPPWPSGDVIHATTVLAPTGGPFAGRKPSGQGRIRSAGYARRGLVVMVHDAVPWTHPETLTPRGAAWHRLMIERIAGYADAILVPSNAVAGELASRFVLGDRLRVIGHGVTQLPASGPSTSSGAAEVRHSFGLPDGGYVLSISTLEPRKGLDVLIAAMARLEGHLVLVGQPGWGGVRVEEVAARAGLRAEHLHVLGRIGDVELAAVFAGAAVMAVPSLAEGFGLPLLEAMAVGVPVVHSDIAALVEVAGGAGIAVPARHPAALAEAIETVLTDQALAGRLRRAGIARSAGFSWARAAELTWRVHVGVAGH